MKLRRFDDPKAFHDATAGFLLTNEAAHNLLLGITADMIGIAHYRDHKPYLATVERDGAVVAAALWTPPHNLLLSIAPPEAVTLIASDVRADRTNLPGVFGPDEVALAFSDAWCELTGRRYEPGIPQRIYRIEAVTTPDGVPGELRPASRADEELILAWLAEFDIEAFGRTEPESARRRLDAYLEGETRGLYVWHDGEPVSIAGYGGPTPNGIRVGPVYTPPEHRRRGYGSAATAALSQLLLDQGRRYCFLFTDRANATTNHIYQEIGYRPVIDVNEYRFTD